jgi:hypothetical protein
VIASVTRRIPAGLAARPCRAEQRGRALGGLLAGESLAAVEQAETEKKHTLRRWPRNGGAGVASGSCEGVEVDMRGQVGLARFGERIGELAATDRLQRVAAAGRTVVEEQRRPR